MYQQDSPGHQQDSTGLDQEIIWIEHVALQKIASKQAVLLLKR